MIYIKDKIVWWSMKKRDSIVDINDIIMLVWIWNVVKTRKKHFIFSVYNTVVSSFVFIQCLS